MGKVWRVAHLYVRWRDVLGTSVATVYCVEARFPGYYEDHRFFASVVDMGKPTSSMPTSQSKEVIAKKQLLLRTEGGHLYGWGIYNDLSEAINYCTEKLKERAIREPGNTQLNTDRNNSRPDH